MKTEFRFGSLPVDWIRKDGLVDIDSASPESAFALKLYLALAVWAEGDRFRGQELEPGTLVECSPTYTQLQDVAGMDRTQIKLGLDWLERRGLLKIQKGKPNLYKILGSEGKGWMKVPSHLVTNHILKDLKPKNADAVVHERNKVLVDALKIYLFLLSSRKQENNRAKVSYDKIVEKTGVARRRVRRALSLLVTLDLIHAENNLRHTPDGLQPACNSYFINGLTRFKAVPTEPESLSA